MATTKRSNPSRHLVEKQRKEREREKIYLNYSRKFDRSSKAFTIPPFESKLNWSINSPNRSCWENTRGPSLELARAFLFHAKRTMPCNAYAISHCPTLIRSLLPPPPLPSPSLPLLLAPLNSFYRSRISPWIVGHCIKGFTSVPPRYPFEPRRGSSDGFMIENTRDKTPVRTQSRKYERSEIMRKQATGRRLN